MMTDGNKLPSLIADKLGHVGRKRRVFMIVISRVSLQQKDQTNLTGLLYTTTKVFHLYLKLG